MGYITNQWLKGNSERNKGHHPISISISSIKSEDSWSKRRRVVGEIHSTRKNKDYQSMYFTKKDLAAILPTLFDLADKELQNQILNASIEKQELLNDENSK